MAERMTFTLDGRDNLTRVLDGAGDSADRLHQRIDDSMTGSSNSVQQFTRDAGGRLRDLNGRFLSAGEAARVMGGNTSGLSPILRNVATSAGGAASQLGAGGGMSGAAAGLAAVVGLTLLPALGALVPMMAGMGVAAGTLALGFQGVGEAAALASTDKEKYAEALKKLSPEAREFTQALVGVKGQFSALAPQIQRAMLPGFTQALKTAKPAVDILGRAMTEMGRGFGDAAAGVGRMMNDAGFRRDFTATLKLGNVFVRDLTRSMGPFVRSLLDFGAASGPTLKAFSDGISGLLGKGLPGMFNGLKSGVAGSAAFLNGLFTSLNTLLPALGRFSGVVATAFGPLLGESFKVSGSIVSGVLSALGAGLKFLTPMFKDLMFAVRSVGQLFGILAPTIKGVASAIFGALLPASSEVDKMRGPFQRLSDAIGRNKQGILEMSRVFGNIVIDMVSTAVEMLPVIVRAFRITSEGILTAMGVIAGAAARFFGWIPGIGEKFRAADRDFSRFKESYLLGLRTAEAKTGAFAQSTAPKLAAGKLKLNIDNWSSQIATAKAKLSDRNLPPGKQAKLTANIKDLNEKIARARRQLDDLHGKTSTTYVRTVFQTKYGTVGHPKGSGGRESATGGPVSGPGTSMSDSIPMWLSDGEYVIRASSVDKYGVGLFDALNQGRLGTAAQPRAAVAAAPQPVVGRPAGATSGGGGMPVYITVNGALDPTAVAEQLRTVFLRLQRNMGLPEGVIMR